MVGPIPVREVGLVSDEKVVLSLDDLAKAKEVAPLVDYAYLSEWNFFPNRGRWQYVKSAMSIQRRLDFVKAAKLKVTKGSLPSDTDFAEQRKVIVFHQRLRED